MTTGPHPVLNDTSPFSSSVVRMATLAEMGAPRHNRGGIHRSLATADAVIDTERGVLFIATNMEPSPEDWAVICHLISVVGFDNGAWPCRRDPGEPEFDALAGVCTWRLEFVLALTSDKRAGFPSLSLWGTGPLFCTRWRR